MRVPPAMYRITQELRFCYGHRLMDYVGKCARIHGHNARVEVVLAASSLDRRGFVMDFDELQSAVHASVDARFDHRLLLRRDDPVIAALEAAGENFVALDENPTAEYLAKSIFDQVKSLGLAVVEVRFWETESSVASYRED